jgi:hypothetical protein
VPDRVRRADAPGACRAAHRSVARLLRIETFMSKRLLYSAVLGTLMVGLGGGTVAGMQTPSPTSPPSEADIAASPAAQLLKKPLQRWGATRKPFAPSSPRMPSHGNAFRWRSSQVPGLRSTISSIGATAPRAASLSSTS